MNLAGDVLQLVGALITAYGLFYAWERLTGRIAKWRQRFGAALAAARAKLTGRSEHRIVRANDMAIGWDRAAALKLEHTVDTTAPLEDQVARLVVVTQRLREELEQTEQQVSELQDRPGLTIDDVNAAIAEALSGIEATQTPNAVRDLRWALFGLGVTALGIVIGMF